MYFRHCDARKQSQSLVFRTTAKRKKNAQINLGKHFPISSPEIFPTNVSSSVVDGYPEHGQLLIRIAAILLLPARYLVKDTCIDYFVNMHIVVFCFSQVTTAVEKWLYLKKNT
jgi:hypothetical protein